MNKKVVITTKTTTISNGDKVRTVDSDDLEVLSNRMGVIESILSDDDVDFSFSPIAKRTEIKSTIPRNLHAPSPPAVDYSSPLPKLNRPRDEREKEERSL